MKVECTEEEYDAWFRAKVKEAMDDKSPTYTNEEVFASVRKIIEKNEKKRIDVI